MDKLEYRTGGHFDMSGYNNEAMSVVFEMTTMFDDSLNERCLIKGLIDKSMNRTEVSAQQYYLNKLTLDNLHYVIGAGEIYCDADGVWQDKIVLYVDRKIDMVVEINLDDVQDGWYAIVNLYSPFSFSAAKKINKFITINDVRQINKLNKESP